MHAIHPQMQFKNFLIWCFYTEGCSFVHEIILYSYEKVLKIKYEKKLSRLHAQTLINN